MNQSLLKSFAPQARNIFRDEFTKRAKLLGLSVDNPAVKAQPVGDRVMIAGYAIPAEWEAQRQKLAERIKKHGWEHVIEEAAYTWFNRFAALRYMEVHGWILKGIRVLTPGKEGTQPEVLARAHVLDFHMLSKDDIVRLKADGTKDEELYRRLLLAVCESLNRNMPLLFPAVHEDFELLLPENLLAGKSLRDWFVEFLPDEEWEEIEILGWLYQYYISELKAEYMSRKKAYQKEEIPAVTQLFTPKWIVQYLVHNSLGRTWLLHHPDSDLKSKMKYYIEPAQQEPEVEAELKQLFAGNLNPEDIRLLDPAMGSGHILVTAYEVLREIYLEQGYQRSQCGRLILEKNLFGLDIDLRATEIACFALIMKAMEDDPSILMNGSTVRLNLLSFRDCMADERKEMIQLLNLPADLKTALTDLLCLFEQGTLFGSLIQVPEDIGRLIPEIKAWIEKAAQEKHLQSSIAAEEALYFVRLAEVLGLKYDQVVSNPPYMGNKGMNPQLKAFVEGEYRIGKSDLFASFILHGFDWLKETGFNAMVTMQSWMFLSSYEELRIELLDNRTLMTMAHLGARAFGQISGEVVQTTAFSFLKAAQTQYKPTFFRLIEGNEEDKKSALEQNLFKHESIIQIDLKKIPGNPLAYWVSNTVRDLFKLTKMDDLASPRAGLATGDNYIFQRYWHEPSIGTIKFNAKSIADTHTQKWYPCHSGGEYRKWYGNHEIIVNWHEDGKEIRNFKTNLGKLRSRPQNTSFFFKEGITWNKISVSFFSARYRPYGFIFDDTGRSAFPNNHKDVYLLLSFLSSNVAEFFLKILNPSMSFTSGDLSSLPITKIDQEKMVVVELIKKHKSDWDAFETSWDFQSLPWLPQSLPAYLADTDIPTTDSTLLESCWLVWRAIGQKWTAEMQRLEEENNRLFIDAYGLQDELTPDVPIKQITLTVNPAYRYKPNKNRKKKEDNETAEAEVEDDTPRLDPAEGERRIREDGARELVSYAIGCIMGRYSLNKPGLAYAEAGGIGFDPTKYTTFPADDDGIVPVTDFQWFEEDAAILVEAFIKTVWGEDKHDANMHWLAEGLGAKSGELPLETLRRYLSGEFYKDHLSTYKKRPIYWKFSSGKDKAFEALVYLHRYNSGTLSRMRMQYVVPLSGLIRNRLEAAEKQVKDAPSTVEQKRLEKESASLRKKLSELLSFDDELNHYAQMQISLDLDDGVRVNYGKFGNLLANVKEICGKTEE